MGVPVSVDLKSELRRIVGRRNVITRSQAMARFVTGFRFGSGPALAVVRPGTLVEQWRVVQACVAADAIVIMQAANTSLTGGSTPDGVYDRPVVIVSTSRLGGFHLIGGGEQVVCLPGATLFDLERKLRRIGREPHSVIGSSCFGASVVGGVCNNSGGALVQRGPAYTEQAIFAQLGADGTLQLVNHLGIDLGKEPEEILRRLERGEFAGANIRRDPSRLASDNHYATHVRDVEASTPARFNADTRRLFEASGSAGRVIVFGVRLDTFPSEPQTSVFYVGTNDPGDLSALRRAILRDFKHLPIAAEYIHRGAFDIAAAYGKDMFAAIRILGTDRLPWLFAARARLDRLGAWLRLGKGFSDRLLYRASKLLPRHLPSRIMDFRDRYEHHLIVRMGGSGADELRAYLESARTIGSGDYFECTPDEAEKAFLHRFIVAGAAARYRTIRAGEVEDIVALDVALPRNAQDWVEHLPPEVDAAILRRLYYGHFLCFVFHQDYLLAKGQDADAIEHAMWKILDERGAEYPAEHNVGHLYYAKPSLKSFYYNLDPQNKFNPGIGKTARSRGWRS